MKFNSTPSIGSQKSDGPTQYLKLKDGETVRGVCRGEVHEHYIIWEGNKSKPAHQGDEGARFRFKINFVTKENGALVARILEQGAVVYSTLKSLHEEFDLTQTIISIKRIGSGKDTTYAIMPTKDFKVTPEMEKQLSYVKLHDLAPKHQQQHAPEPLFDDVPPHDDSDLPF